MNVNKKQWAVVALASIVSSCACLAVASYISGSQSRPIVINGETITVDDEFSHEIALAMYKRSMDVADRYKDRLATQDSLIEQLRYERDTAESSMRMKYERMLAEWKVDSLKSCRDRQHRLDDLVVSLDAQMANLAQEQSRFAVESRDLRETVRQAVDNATKERDLRIQELEEDVASHQERIAQMTTEHSIEIAELTAHYEAYTAQARADARIETLVETELEAERADVEKEVSLWRRNNQVLTTALDAIDVALQTELTSAFSAKVDAVLSEQRALMDSLAGLQDSEKTIQSAAEVLVDGLSTLSKVAGPLSELASEGARTDEVLETLAAFERELKNYQGDLSALYIEKMDGLGDALVRSIQSHLSQSAGDFKLPPPKAKRTPRPPSSPVVNPAVVRSEPSVKREAQSAEPAVAFTPPNGAASGLVASPMTAGWSAEPLETSYDCKLLAQWQPVEWKMLITNERPGWFFDSLNPDIGRVFARNEAGRVVALDVPKLVSEAGC